MNVKSDFLNGFIKEEVFFKQPHDFENPSYPNYVFKLSKDLYGLKQAPKAWYECLSTFLLKNNFQRGKIDTTLFTQKLDSSLLIVQIYMDDIIFGNSNSSLCEWFTNLIKGEFEMSLMGELMFLL